MSEPTPAPFELRVQWNAGEEDVVTFVTRAETLDDAKAAAKDWLALIREQRQLYNDLVMKPLRDKQDELEEALITKQGQLRAVQAELDALTATPAPTEH